MEFVATDEVRAFDEHSVENNIEVQFEISHLIITIFDWIELQKLLLSLNLSFNGNSSMSVDLELPDYIFDLYNLEVLLLSIKEHVVCLSIRLFSIYSKGLINLKFLLSIELLKLHCCGVQKSFSKCNKLRELKYTPDYVLNYSSTMERLNHVDLLGLSLPLKALDLW